jgi:site-specific recombinase XerC
MQIMLKAGLRDSEATVLRAEQIGLVGGKVMVREGKGAKDRTL